MKPGEISPGFFMELFLGTVMTLHHSFAQDNMAAQVGVPFALEAHAQPMESGALQKLSAWISGHLALTRSDAHSLLESLVESGHIAQHRAVFVAAVKALAAGPSSWTAMGYRVLPDD